MRTRSITKHAFQAIAEGTLIALMVVVLAAGTAFAGKPAAKTSGSITVAPTQVALGTTYYVSGSGFKPDMAVNINLAQPYCCRAFTVIADSSGNWAFETLTNMAGTYKVDGYQKLNGRKLTLMGTTSFVVQ